MHNPNLQQSQQCTTQHKPNPNPKNNPKTQTFPSQIAKATTKLGGGVEMDRRSTQTWRLWWRRRKRAPCELSSWLRLRKRRRGGEGRLRSKREEEKKGRKEK
ncbi:hypothetical protein E2542_SST13309 [Spatholobus suberectus]|nr:hypothetical protein E2542_SST13309 [Spatholobus suberectus]